MDLDAEFTIHFDLWRSKSILKPPDSSSSLMSGSLQRILAQV